MGQNDQELLKRLLATFKIEAEEHISALSAGLIELEKVSSTAGREQTLERVFREAHSLKGAARSVNLVRIESLCQSLEGLFASLKAHEVSLSPELFDQLHHMVDALGTMLSASSTPAEGSDRSRPPRIPELREPGATGVPRPGPQESQAIKNLNSPSSATGIRMPPAELGDARIAGEERPGRSQTVRVPETKVVSLLRQAEEFLPVKATAIERIAELREIHESLAEWQKESRSMRSQARDIPKFLNGEHGSAAPTRASNGQTATRFQMKKILAFLDRNDNVLNSVENKVAVLARDLANDRRVLERRVDDFVEELNDVSMVPVSTWLESFPKLVRDLSRDFGKDAYLLIEGGEIEADRRILEEMKDPLVHLLRNCIDHGIETAKQRVEKGKPPQATLAITISAKSADKIEIMVADDGAGIDIEKVRTAAAQLGLVSPEDARQMDEQQSLSLIFKSAVTTSPMLTEVSGRGLGLAIVREKTEAFGGTVSVETRLGIGTTFRLVLPYTHARFRGVLVRVGENLFVLPTASVQRVLRVGSEEVKSAENRESIQYNGRAASAVRLGDVLELPPGSAAADLKRKVPVLVVLSAGEQIAFLVDEILDEREVLVKSLGRQLLRVRNIAGATVLGNGRILPVLNVADLVQTAIRMAPSRPARGTEQAPKSILVAEDSITSRTLIKNILESAGYKVETAVDGAEAFTVLSGGDFDLVVSDVEMPAMSGIDLTIKIRADKRLGALPVVLVTGLDSAPDRERGADAGANAYLVKTSFDQSNLLEVVRRLI